MASQFQFTNQLKKLTQAWVMVFVMCALEGCLCTYTPPGNNNHPPQASFIFGDSLVDAGNNNYIGSLARANYGANGVDFPGGKATGRFCNGRTVADIIGKLPCFSLQSHSTNLNSCPKHPTLAISDRIFWQGNSWEYPLDLCFWTLRRRARPSSEE